MVRKIVLIRISLFAVLWGSLFLLLYQHTFTPYVANHQKKLATDNLELMRVNPDSAIARALARRNLEILMPYASSRTDPVLHNLIGINLEFLKRDEEAARAYQRALAIEQRPELYHNLALVQLKLGNRDAAIESMTKAVLFTPYIMIPDAIRQEVRARATEIQKSYDSPSRQ